MSETQQASALMSNEHIVARASELPPGAHTIVKVRSLEIGLFNVEGAYYAWHNLCPHQFGPTCSGRVGGKMICGVETDWKFQWTRDGEIVTCPWHGMEFDIKTGESLSRTDMRMRQIPVRVVEDEIVVQVGGRTPADQRRVREG